MLSYSSQLHKPLFNHFSMYFCNKPSFLFFSQNPTSSVSLLHLKQHFCFWEFSVFRLCANIPCSERFTHEAAQMHTPFFKCFLLCSRVPLFSKAWISSRQIHEPSSIFAPSLYPWTTRLLVVPSHHLLPQGPSRWALADQLQCDSTRCRGKVCTHSSVTPVHSLLCCL